MEGRHQLTRKNCRLDDKSVRDILINLPVKSLMRFKCVSKTWQSFIEDPCFVQLHLSRSKKHPQLLITTTSYRGDSITFYSPKDEFRGGVALHRVIIPSYESFMSNPINGLFCFFDKHNAVTRIYNLATRQLTPWAQTSVPLQRGDSITQTPTYGFGFDPSSNKYKILCIWEISRGGFVYQMIEHVCEVFTVGENQWRRIDEVPPLKVHGDVVYANGSMYMKNANPLGLMFPPDNEVIVAFDVRSEKFRVIQIPDIIVFGSSGTRRTKDLVEIDGCIALVDRVDQYLVKLWISDDSCKEKKVTTNWTEETISLPSSFVKGQFLSLNPVQGTDEIVIKAHVPFEELQSQRGFVSLYIYNRTMKSFREIEITGIAPLLPSPHAYGMFVFHESLLPIQDAEEKLDEATPMDTS